MKRFSLSSLLVLGVMASGIFWSACAPPKPTGPTPEELAAQAARERARADSVRAADEAARLAREAEARRVAEEAAAKRRAEEEAAAARRAAEEELRRKAALSTVYFDYDRFNVRDDQKATLDKNAQKLRDYRPEDRVTLEGYCDERGTVEYNLALGDRRANRVKRYLVSAGIDAGRLDTISYGEERPAVMGSNENAWAKNRRVELKRQQ